MPPASLVTAPPPPDLETHDARADDAAWRIVEVEPIALRIPFATPVKIASGAARPFVETLLVRLLTRSGLVGWGETQAWRRQGSAESLPRMVAAVRDHLAPAVLGRSCFDIAPIAADMDAALWHSLYTQAAILDALVDLQGRALGLPAHRLFGGRCRDRLEACAVLTIRPSLAETLASAEAFFDRGFRAFTVKVGIDAAADLRNVRGLRERFGDDVLIRVDANASMRFDDALMLLRRIEPFGIDAAEQLLAIDDLAGMAELARRFPIPVMADECVATGADLVDVIRHRAASSVQTKVAKNGGLWRGRGLWAIADAAGMRIYPGNHPSTTLATASVLHLAASWPGALMEGPFAAGVSGALAEDIAVAPLRTDGPCFLVPDGPGFGVEIDERRVEKLRVA